MALDSVLNTKPITSKAKRRERKRKQQHRPKISRNVEKNYLGYRYRAQL